MKWVAMLMLLAGSLWRLSVWQQRIDLTERFCGVLSLKDFRKSKGAPLRVRLAVFEGWSGRLESSGLQVFWGTNWLDFNGKVALPESLKIEIPWQGKLEIEGTFECDSPHRNLSGVQDQLFRRSERRLILKPGPSSWKKSTEKNGALLVVRQRFRIFLKKLLFGYSGVGGWVWAVWTGDASGLDSRLIEMYREGGLLPVVALSGQHVTVLLVLFRIVLAWVGYPLFAFPRFREKYRLLERLLPVLGSLVLTATSGATPSVLRTLAMVLSVFILRVRRCFSSTVQIVCSSAALLLFWDPGLLAGISFVLSCTGTFLLVEVAQAENPRGALKQYLFLSLVMSLLSAPLILFYFAQWSYFAPIVSIILSWLWNLVFIPVGFVTPLFAILPNEMCHTILRGLNGMWLQLTQWQLSGSSWIEESYFAYPRLTILETLLIQSCCLWIFQRIFKKKGNSEPSF